MPGEFLVLDCLSKSCKTSACGEKNPRLLAGDLPTTETRYGYGLRLRLLQRFAVERNVESDAFVFFVHP